MTLVLAWFTDKVGEELSEYCAWTALITTCQPMNKYQNGFTGAGFQYISQFNASEFRVVHSHEELD